MSELDFEGYLAEQGLPTPGVIDEPQQEETTQDTPDTPVAETPEPEQQQAEPQPELILGKYKDADALAEAYKNLEREKGRLAQELGEARQQATPQVPQTPVDPSTVEEVFATNPAAARQAATQAATRALEQNDRNTYERIIETWGQYDQFGALRFDAARQAIETQQAFAAQIAPQVQTAKVYADQHANEAATKTVQTRHPDFQDVVGDLADETRVTEIVNAGFPVALLEKANGTEADKVALLETLYRWIKADQAEKLVAAAPVVEAETRAQNKQAKQQSAVASASSQPASEGTSAEEKELEAFYDFLKAPSPTSWADLRPAGQ